MADKNLEKLLAQIETHLKRMCDPNHPVFRMVIEREGYGLDANGQPEVTAFHMKLEHLSAVVHLPVSGVSGLVLPGGMNGAPIRPMAPVVEEPVVASPLETSAP